MSELDELPDAEIRTFTCDSCGKTSEKGWSDEQAAAEFESLIPPDSDLRVVCDECFRRIMGRVQLEAPELLRPGAPLVAGACYRTPLGMAVHYTGCWCPR